MKIKDLLNEQQYVSFIHPKVLDDNGRLMGWEHWIGLVDEDGSDDPFIRGLQHWAMYTLLINHGANSMGYTAEGSKHFDWEHFLEAITNYVGESDEFIDTVIMVLEVMNEIRPTIVITGFMNNTNLWGTPFDDVVCMSIYSTLHTGIKNYFECIILDYLGSKEFNPELRLKQLGDFIDKAVELVVHDNNYTLIRKCLKSDLFNVATKLSVKRVTAHGKNETVST